MNYTKLLLLLLLLPFCAIAQIQSVEVDYVFKMQTDNNEQFVYYNKLIDNGSVSLFGYLASADSKEDIGSKKDGVYYDRSKDQALLLMPIFSKDFHIADDKISDKLHWSLAAEEKEILGYKCKSATLDFRGRSYVAFYAEDILFDSGPFKFRGLPGLILEIHTTDEKFHFVATKLNLKKESIVVANPYAKLKADQFISFGDYKTLFLKKLSEAQNKFQTEEKDDVSYEVKDQSMELKD